ncbi:MAG TPA: hypothetical protein VJW73_16905, partial [Gemmatimonadaceae bacterium]|nr:hypothetical protein [Gemmatimonadaceae bacterium]
PIFCALLRRLVDVDLLASSATSRMRFPPMSALEKPLSAPANSSSQPRPTSPIAGSVLPIKRAEELLATLPGVIAARIVASDSGQVDEIHVLTTDETTPKQTVRNIESALIAHLGMRVDHRKISVATTIDPQKRAGGKAEEPASNGGGPVAGPPEIPNRRRQLYFEDVEVRRSRSKGVACRVTLRKGDQSFVGEAEGVENERSRIELAARATLAAITQSEGDRRVFALDGCKVIDAFDREFAFAGVTAKMGRESTLLTGSCEVKDSPETASVLAVLDATNRWIAK